MPGDNSVGRDFYKYRGTSLIRNSPILEGGPEAVPAATLGISHTRLLAPSPAESHRGGRGMFGNVTALEGLHVTGKYRDEKHDAQMHAAWVLHSPPTSGQANGSILCQFSQGGGGYLGSRGTYVSGLYRGDSKLRTHTALGSYGRASPTSIGPP